MKKTFSFLTGRKALWTALFTFVCVLIGTNTSQAQNQIRYKPSDAMGIIERLPLNEQSTPPQSSSLGTSASSHGTGSARVTQASADEKMNAMRSVYYRAVLGELRIESKHNNSIQGTQNALQRAYNKMIPSDSSSPRYVQIVQIHNFVVTVLSRHNG